MASGCGQAPWEKASSASPAATASSTASPTASPSQPKVVNDLSRGSLKRTLGAGGVTLAVVYYSTLSMADWTPAATKPLTLSLVADFADGSTQNIYLTETTLDIDVAGDDGPLAPLKPIVDKAPVKPGYLVKAPTSYGQVFTIPALPSAARSVTVNFTYELLVQSAPKSNEYSRQSAGDTVIIALAEP
jgi:hypothetical protein